MTHQIIVMPETGEDDSLRFAIFSTGTNRWIRSDMSAEEVIEYYAGLAKKEAKRRVRNTISQVVINPAEAYAQFALTFEEANGYSVASGGQDLIHCGLVIGEINAPDQSITVRCTKPRNHPGLDHSGSVTFLE